MFNDVYQVPETELIAQAKQEGIVAYGVGAGIIRGGKVLIVRRSPGDFLGGYYEIPGGGVDPGESLEAAVRREVMEETGLVTDSLIGMFDGFDYVSENGKKTRLFNFIVTVHDGSIVLRPAEHDQSSWLSENDLEKINFSSEMKHSVVSLFKNLK